MSRGEVTPLDSPRPPTKESREKARYLAEPLTPKSERPRKTWGSLEMSLQTLQGLCEVARKCIKKKGHAGNCYPT